MDGVHNLGGKQGFGPVRYKTINHVFRAAWEPRAIAVYSMGLRPRLINRDKYRDAIERMEPRHYLSVSYYERLRAGFVTLCVEKGIVTREDLKKLAGGASPLSLPSAEGRVPRESFEIGEKVHVKNEFVSGHVHMPGYIRGKIGVVVSVSPVYPCADAAAHDLQAQDEPTYDPRFRAANLFLQAAVKVNVHVGLFECYLEKAP